MITVHWIQLVTIVIAGISFGFRLASFIHR